MSVRQIVTIQAQLGANLVHDIKINRGDTPTIRLEIYDDSSLQNQSDLDIVTSSALAIHMTAGVAGDEPDENVIEFQFDEEHSAWTGRRLYSIRLDAGTDHATIVNGWLESYDYGASIDANTEPSLYVGVPGPQGPAGESVVGPQGPAGESPTLPGANGELLASDGAGGAIANPAARLDVSEQEILLGWPVKIGSSPPPALVGEQLCIQTGVVVGGNIASFNQFGLDSYASAARIYLEGGGTNGGGAVVDSYNSNGNNPRVELRCKTDAYLNGRLRLLFKTITTVSDTFNLASIVAVNTPTIAAPVLITASLDFCNTDGAVSTISDMGEAGTHTITIAAPTGRTVNGQPSIQITQNYGSVRLVAIAGNLIAVRLNP